MRLIFVGKTKDDKGTQLEKLTQKILSHQGYSNIATNVQVSGASELDVSASKKEKTGVKDIEIPVICECKAHEKPIVMTDWLKFIGKVMIARKQKANTIGLMLALSGANGAVIGSYTTDFADDPAIQLIANDDIINLISSVYNLPNPEMVSEVLSQLPIPAITDIDLLYYNEKVWWLVGFEEGSFTLCHANTKTAEISEVVDLLPLLPSVTRYQANKFVDVMRSINLSEHLRRLELLIVSVLITDGSCRIDECLPKLTTLDSSFSVTEDLVIKTINQSLLIIEKNGSISLKPDEEIDFPDFYRRILQGPIPLELLKSDFYARHINQDFLSRVWEIQNGFFLDNADDIEKCLLILKVSPTALSYSLVPDQMFSGFKAIADKNDQMKQLYQSHYISELQKRLLEDYQNPALGYWYLNTQNIDSIRVKTEILLTHKGEEVVIASGKKLRLANMEGTSQAVLINTII